ncbi:GumC family protein [Chamaesiphon minutus]|uniref:non-specific protein-tyrosine kinase n=1 Tax=Chamaesiphon minutus (strain ATCC 27169 / PCC 6605) TaxID=1173020 RepID=K9UI51_CHAP6|nr:polysaccharide biosynthesis tyrosine autokinase [Chamaesiphon minutus]AFY93874.1 capsular exopolysaccharide biosynthesis protein [Chamaesiphon minutus PCC 6605]
MESQESIDLNLSHYLFAVKRHWIPAVSIFAATVALSIAAASLLKPSYQAEGRLLFKNSTFRVIGPNLIPSNMEGSESGDLKSLVSNQNPITTQMEVIASRPLLQRTADRLKLKNDRGKLLTASDIHTGLTTKIIGGSDILQIGFKGRNSKDAANIVNTLMNVYLENDIQASRLEAENARQFIEQQMPKTLAAVNSAESAVRNFKQQNNIVDLSEEAKSAVGVIGNLENNINAVRSELEQANAQSQELYKKVNLNSQDALAVSAISQSPAIQGILTQLQDVDRQLATESSRFSDDNPIIVGLKEKQSKLKALLEQQIRSTIGSQAQIPQGLLKIGDLKQNLITELLRSQVQQTGLVNKLNSLQSSRAAYEKRVSVIPKLVQTQRQLERQLEVSQATYQSLLKKVQELQVARNKSTSNARIISSAAIPEKPEPGPKLILGILGGLVGALLGTSAIAYLELRDSSLKTVKEIDKIFGYTLLGMIPATQKKKIRSRATTPEQTTLEIAVRDTPQSITSEMSRTIQSNLRFLSADKPLKIIAITSSVANEGKSKVAANLAAAIAGMGQKVLLIDADMRVPYQHRFWKLPLRKGLSELIERKSKLQQISWTVMENLDVLTAGARPSNPLSALESKQMKLLIQEVSKSYDFVIIDVPPILVASDALTVGQIADGVLLVSRPGVINAKDAKAVQEKFKMSQCNVLGLIVNGVIQKYETEDYFSASQEYFSVEEETEAPWTDYMTKLGETIADRSQSDTIFIDTEGVTTMLGKSTNFHN